MLLRFVRTSWRPQSPQRSNTTHSELRPLANEGGGVFTFTYRLGLEDELDTSALQTDFVRRLFVYDEGRHEPAHFARRFFPGDKRVELRESHLKKRGV